MKKTIDLLVVSCLLISSFFIWYAFTLKAVFGFVLFAFLPVAYLYVRGGLPIKRILYGSITLGALLGGTFDLIQSYNQAWLVDVAIPYLILGTLPLDNVIGYFCMTFLVVAVYEYFFQPPLVIGRRFYKETAVIAAIALVVAILFTLTPQVFNLPYSYLVGGTAAAMLTCIGIVRHRELLDPALRMSAYFLPVWLVCELTALATGGWWFPGEYVGWIDIFGLGFPFEEFFFWMLWYAPFLVVAYAHLFRDKTQLS